jgi:hypothetical protein
MTVILSEAKDLGPSLSLRTTLYDYAAMNEFHFWTM